MRKIPKYIFSTVELLYNLAKAEALNILPMELDLGWKSEYLLNISTV